MSTRASNPARAMAAWPFTRPGAEVLEEIRRAMAALPRVRERSPLAEAEGNTLRFECRSAVLRFVDDVEFELDLETRLVHFRSASRLGYSDFGVNRARMGRIGEMLSGKL